MARSKTKKSAIASTETVTVTATTTVDKPASLPKVEEVGNPTPAEKKVLRKIDRLQEVRDFLKEYAEEEDALKKEIMPIVVKYKLEVVNTKNTEAKKVDGKRRSWNETARTEIFNIAGKEKYIAMTTINTKSATRYIAEIVLNNLAEIKNYSYLKLTSLIRKPSKKTYSL